MTEQQQKEKHLVLYQICPKRGNCQYAEVLPATEQGIKEAQEKAKKGYKAMLMMFFGPITNDFTLLYECDQRHRDHKYKEIAA